MNAIKKTSSVPHTPQEEGQHHTNRASTRKGQGGSGAELIKPKKLLNPVKASRNHQEMHRELLMNHRRWERSPPTPHCERPAW